MFAELIGVGFGVASDKSIKECFNEIKKELFALGITPDRETMLPPEADELHRALAGALHRTDVVIICGGLGIGPGDITVSAVSQAVGIPLSLSEKALKYMKDYKDVSGVTPTSAQRRAMLPQGATVFPNPHGAGFGVAVSAGAQCIIMLPKTVTEVVPMLVYHVGAYLTRFTEGEKFIRSMRLFGMSATEAEDILGDRLNARNPAICVFADMDETIIQVTARAVTPEQAENTATATVKTLLPMFSHSVYAVDVKSVGEALVQELYAHNKKIAVAEQETGDALICSLASVNMAGEVVAGKESGFDGLELSEKKLKKQGIHSPWAAMAAADAIMKKTGADIATAITMDSGDMDNPCIIAVTNVEKAWLRSFNKPGEERFLARDEAAKTALHLARAIVRDPESEGGIPLAEALKGKTQKGVKSCGKAHVGRNILIAVISLILAGVLGLFGWLYYKGDMNRKNYKELSNMLKAGAQSELALPENYPEENLKEFAQWLNLNPDTVGRIYIPGTAIDYPVLKSERPSKAGVAGQYYLDYDFYGNESFWGAPFMEHKADISPENRSDNINIYAHNLNDGQMFGELTKYKQLSFYRENPIIEFTTLREKESYKIIAVVLASAYEKDGPVWDYNMFINDDGESGARFISQSEKRSLIVTGVKADENDKFLTLSTADYSFKGARIIIVARALREGESEEIDTNKAYYNPTPAIPEKWLSVIAQAQAKEGVVTELSLPTSDTIEPEPMLSEPEKNTPEPEMSTPEPEESTTETEESTPAPETSTPAPQTSTPAPETSTPAPETSTPAPETSTPAPQTSTPEPQTSTTTPQTSTNTPKNGTVPVVTEKESPITPAKPPVDPNKIAVPGASSGGKTSGKVSPSGSGIAIKEDPEEMGGAKTESETTPPEEEEEEEENSYSGKEKTFRVNGSTYSEYDAICQIVAAEMGTGTKEVEALKAQAVAAYSYIKSNGGSISGAVLRNPTDTIKNAVSQVIGKALYDDRSGAYVSAVYSAESCGVTADSRWVWGGANRNLLSVEGFDGAEKSFTISADDFADKVYSKLRIDLSGDPEDWIEIDSYWGDSDYVKDLYIGDEKVSARKLRENCLGGTSLRSTAFTVSYNSKRDSFTFTTKGYGHGVGMSQIGAINMAKEGYTYDEILLHYYSNCVLK